MSARRTVERAYKAIDKQPKFWQHVNKLAKIDYETAHRMSMKYYLESARRNRKISKEDSERYAIANATAPALSRFLLMEHPEYEGLLVINDSEVDAIFANKELLAEIMNAEREVIA